MKKYTYISVSLQKLWAPLWNAKRGTQKFFKSQENWQLMKHNPKEWTKIWIMGAWGRRVETYFSELEGSGRVCGKHSDILNGEEATQRSCLAVERLTSDGLDQYSMWEGRSLLSVGAGSVQKWDRVGKALSQTENSWWGPYVGRQPEMHNILLSNSENPMWRTVDTVVIRAWSLDPH